jgi:hypothetical protein
MKIGRNDPCPCGSGKKYKHCCLNKLYVNEYDQIRSAVHQSGYADEVADVLCQLLRYMKGKNWIGACHATASVLFVCLSELGYSPKLCIGEVRDQITGTLFDHSWIELDGKIIDLAISMTLLGGLPLSAPIIFGQNVTTFEGPTCIYGVADGRGLDDQANHVMTIPFQAYMDNYLGEKEGLWGVVRKIMPGKTDLLALRQKYINSPWNYICE